MQKRHGLLIAISLGALIPGMAMPAERGAMADFADAVYRLKGLQHTAAAVRDRCAASFPENAGAYQQGYQDWTTREAALFAEIAGAYERVLDLKSADSKSQRNKVLEQDEAVARLLVEQTRKSLDAVPRESLAIRCAGYSDFLLGMNETAPFISTQLRVLRSAPADARAPSGRP